MADFFVDDSVVGGGDDGTDWDTNAFNTGGNRGIKTALESAGYAPGDKIWIRRTTVYDEAIAAQNADIAPTDDGTAAAPLEFIGWPRTAIPNTTITAADWTNGSTIVDNVVGITPVRERHQARYVTAPDGFQYLITAILWEFTVDGMGAGDEFTVGSQLNHTGNTRKGQVYAFVDNLDTTGTIQAVLDAEQTWDNTDNITDADGGDAELSANATAVGFIIDREYAGTTVTGVDGKFQIEADEDYATRPDVGGLRAAWDADALNLPIIDFNNEAYQLYFAGNNFYTLKNIEFKDGVDATGIIRYNYSSRGDLVGLLFKQNSNKACISTVSTAISLKRFVAEGNGVGAAQSMLTGAQGPVFFSDGAIYNMGDYGTGIPVPILQLQNVNVGIEIPNGDDDLGFAGNGFVEGIDVQLGGSNGYYVAVLSYSDRRKYLYATIENYGKVLGEHRMFYPGGITQRAAVAGETPNKKLSDYVLKITPNVDYAHKYEEGQCVLFEHEYELQAGVNTIKYWLYNDVGVTLNNGDARADIYLVAEYVVSYDDTSEYIITKAYSTEATIADAADADDWDSLSVTMTLATASKVRVRLLISYYDVTGDIFIDAEAPEINGKSTEGYWSYGLSKFKANFPGIGDVRDATDYDFGDKTGNLELPIEGDVEDGVGYGSNGIELTGNVTLPSEGDVLIGTDYGASGTEFTGTLPAVADYPSESDVEDGVIFDSGVRTGNLEIPSEADVEDGVGYGSNGTEFTGSLDLPSENDVRKGVDYDSSTKTGNAICAAILTFPSAGLDPTARLANVKDSLKKYFVDSLYTGEGIALTFDKGLSTPPTLQGTAVNQWVSINLNLLEMETLSTLILNIYCCTRGDAEGFRLAQLRDKVMDYLTDTEQSDSMKRIPFYRSRASGNWTLLAGGFVVQDVTESGELEAPDETKYRILTAKLRFASKI